MLSSAATQAATILCSHTRHVIDINLRWSVSVPYIWTTNTDLRSTWSDPIADLSSFFHSTLHNAPDRTLFVFIAEHFCNVCSFVRLALVSVYFEWLSVECALQVCVCCVRLSTSSEWINCHAEEVTKPLLHFCGEVSVGQRKRPTATRRRETLSSPHHQLNEHLFKIVKRRFAFEWMSAHPSFYLYLPINGRNAAVAVHWSFRFRNFILTWRPMPVVYSLQL